VFSGTLARQRFKYIEAGVCHPLVYRERLTPEADAIADSFVYDEYVRHDCKALESLTHVLPARYGVTTWQIYTRSPTSPAACPSALGADRGLYLHLVRNSRRVVHDCWGGALLATTIRASECLRYSTVGRWHTQQNGYACERTTPEIFLRKYGNRWFVIAEMTNRWSNATDGCNAEDLSQWDRRLPWIQQ
jgi:hypothetical protein